MTDNTPEGITVFLCEDSVEGILTALYDARKSGLGHRHTEVQLKNFYNYDLFKSTVLSVPSAQKAQALQSYILQKIGPAAWQILYRVMLSCDPKKTNIIHQYLVGGFYYGGKSLNMLTEPSVDALWHLNHLVGSESHYYKEFLRFESIGRHMLIGRIAPKNSILSLVTPHFADRLPDENFLILDTGRSTAAVHPRSRNWFLMELEEAKLQSLFPAEHDDYIALWKTFFHSVAIEERRSPKLQQAMLPLRYRKYMPEF